MASLRSVGLLVGIAAWGIIADGAHGRRQADLTITWDAGNDDDGPIALGSNDIGSRNGSVGPQADARGVWSLEWDVVSSTGDSAAAGESYLLTATFFVTNNDVEDQNFSLLMTVPIDGPLLNPSLRGSVIGTVTDLTFDGAAASAPLDDRIYTPRIDGIDEAAGFLMEYPFSAGPGGFGVQEFGFDSPVTASQDVDDSIALRLTFDVTPGDSVTMVATFEVLPGLANLAGDLDGDGSVCILDFLQLLAAWGACSGCPEDLDGDEFVGITDLLELLANWGLCS